MVLQSCPVGHSPMFHLLAQPQTKNMNSEFNERCVQKVILPAFEACHEEGMNAILLGVSVDGVSVRDVARSEERRVVPIQTMLFHCLNLVKRCWI